MASVQNEIRSLGVSIAFVHRAVWDKAKPFVEKAGLTEVSVVDDPQGELFEMFEIKEGSISQLFSPTVLFRGAGALFKGYGFSPPKENPWTMPGAFVIFHGQIQECFWYRTIADRPDYLQFVNKAISRF